MPEPSILAVEAVLLALVEVVLAVHPFQVFLALAQEV
jgi:hypothetical protein